MSISISSSYIRDPKMCFLVLFRMSELGIARDCNSVVFGQLLGMCDHVTLSLG